MASSNFSNEELARISAATLIGIVGGILSLRKGDSSVVILWWLLYVIITGITLNSAKGCPIYSLILGSLGSAFTGCGVITFHALTKGIITVSGYQFDPSGPGRKILLYFLSFYFMVTFLGVVLATYARPTFLGMLSSLGDENSALKWEKIVNAAVKIVGGLTLLFGALAL
jgi:hypothetical protein